MRRTKPRAPASAPAAKGTQPPAVKAASATMEPAGGRDGRKVAPAAAAAPPIASSALEAGEATDLAPIVGSNLRRLRTRRGLSLEKLSQLSGVSRAMLGQIELGQSAPTINVLWKIARALEVTFSALISSRTQSGVLVDRKSVV
jgi:DNA-binding XRE family transcriptional regulator